MELSQSTTRPRVKALVKKWISTGWLVVVRDRDDMRRERNFVELGAWPNADCSTAEGDATQGDAAAQTECATTTLL
jgi:hypothetical protein